MSDVMDLEDVDEAEAPGEFELKQIRLRFEGTAPLLMSSERGVNYLDPVVKQKKALTGRKKKTEEDLEQVTRLEWEIALYYEPKTKDDKGPKQKWYGPYLPAQNIEASLRDGARFEKRGRDVERGVTVLEDKIRLEYKGPKDLDKLWDAGFSDIRSVKQQQARIMKCRPKFPEWAIEFDLTYDASLFNRQDVVRIAQLAGKYGRIGDFRRRFGRYAVTEVEGG